jgi:hypothetical protein
MHFSLQMAGADMSVNMLLLLLLLKLPPLLLLLLLRLLLLLAAVTQAAAIALTNSTLTTDQLHTVLYVWNVAHRHFAPGRPLIVSLLRTSPDVARSFFSEPLPQTDNLQTVNALLGKLHEGTRWPIELFRPSGDVTADISVLQPSYIGFVWNEEAGSLNETLKNQVENLNMAHGETLEEDFLWWQLRGAMNQHTYGMLTFIPYFGKWPELSTWWS